MTIYIQQQQQHHRHQFQLNDDDDDAVDAKADAEADYLYGKKRGIGGWLANPSLNAVMYLLTGDTVMSAIHLSKSKREKKN